MCSARRGTALSTTYLFCSLYVPGSYLSLLMLQKEIGSLLNIFQLGTSSCFFYPQNYLVLLDSTLSKSQYDYTLPQISFTTVGYHKHITLVFNPSVSIINSFYSGYTVSFLTFVLPSGFMPCCSLHPEESNLHSLIYLSSKNWVIPMKQLIVFYPSCHIWGNSY